MFRDPRSQKFSLYSQFLQDLCLSLLLISIVFEIATIRRSDSFSHAIIAENEIAVFDAGLLFQRNVRQPREYALNVFLPTNLPGGGVSMVRRGLWRVPSLDLVSKARSSSYSSALFIRGRRCTASSIVAESQSLNEADFSAIRRERLAKVPARVA